MGGKTSTSTSSTSVPPEVLAQYQNVNKIANQVAQTPFQTYNGQFVAPLTQEQNAGINTTNQYANAAQPYMQGAAGLTLAGANGVNAGQANVGQFMNPYLGSAYSAALAGEQMTNAQQAQGLTGNAIQSGAFGGDRLGVAQANLAYQQNLANNQANANMLNTGYQNAQAAALQEQQLQTQTGLANQQLLQSAGTNLANIGSTAQQAGLAGAAAQQAAGLTQQQTQQAQDTAQYNQFLQQQAYPFQTAQFLANIAEGTGALSGSTTTSTQPSSFFSDRRLKDDVQKIGETFDGQPIYKYRYKGENATQIGLMAQDVEKKHPDAVGENSGFKTVDYDRATSDAAERGGFASGGGTVSAENAGQGFAYGGLADLAALAAQQQSMYGNKTGGLNINSGPYGTAGAASGGQHQMLQSHAPVAAPAQGLGSDLQNAANAGKNVQTLYGMGKATANAGSDLYNWGKGEFNSLTASPADTDPSSFAAMDYIPEKADGGRAGFGFGDIPYEDPQGIVPDDKPNVQTLQTHSAPVGLTQSAAGQDVMGLARLASLAALFNRGGRAGFADGGDTSDAPDPVDSTIDALKQRQAMPRNLRNNNPGNIEDGPFAKAMPGYSGTDGRYAIFDKPENGSNAQDALLQSYGARGFNTPAAIVGRWAPQGDENSADSVSNYTKTVAAAAGVGPNDKIDMTDPSVRARVASAMARFEGGLGAGAATPSATAPAPTADVGQNAPSGFAPMAAQTAPEVPRPQTEREKDPDWFSQHEQTIVPILAGLGAMASSPSRYLGSALLQGLAGGAQAYTGLQKQQQDLVNQTQEAQGTKPYEAQTGRQSVAATQQRNALETMRYLTTNFKPFVDQNTNQRMWRDDVSGTIMTDADHASRMASLSGMISNIPGAAPVKPSITQTPLAAPVTNSAPVSGGVTAPAPVAAQSATAPAQTAANVPSGIDAKIASASDKPSVLKQKIEAIDKTIATAQSVGNFDQVNQLMSQRDQLQKHADEIVSGAYTPLGTDGNPVEDYKKIANDRAQSAQLSEAIGKERGDYNQSANAFLKEYPENQQLLHAMSSVYQSINTNRATPDIADAVGYLRSIPGLKDIIPASMATTQGGYDAAQKAAVTQAFASIADNQAQKAPRTALTEAIQTVANPTMAPEARYNILTRKMGEIERQKEMYEDWITQGRPDPTQFAIQWNKAPEHQLDKYIQTAQKNTPSFKDMAPLPGNNPPSSNQPVVVKSADEARKLPSGTVFLTPDGRRKVAP